MNKILNLILRFMNVLFMIGTIIILFSFISYFENDLFARPGGGHSFSSGSGNSSGSDSLIGFLFELIIRLIFYFLPSYIAIPLCILIVVIFLFYGYFSKSNKDTVTSEPSFHSYSKSIEKLEERLSSFQKTEDLNFSRIVFLDFVSSLYYKFYTWQNTPNFINIHPFISDKVKEEVISNQKKSNYTEIVIGSIQITKLQDFENYKRIEVNIEANYTGTNQGESIRYIVNERWMFNRNKGVQSLEPEKMRKSPCPNCGASTNFTDAGQCTYCKTFIIAGESQWMLNKRVIIKQEQYKQNSLATYEEEIGTDDPTIYQMNLQEMETNFKQKYQIPDWNAYWKTYCENIITPCFIEINKAWSENNCIKFRHLVSDRLYESYNFWLDNFKTQKLTNKIENSIVQQIEISKIEMDRFYDTITVRIFASSLDYIVDKQGKVVGGSSKKPRLYSEYWTFMRRSGIEKNISKLDLNHCPNCGAVADKFGQAGECGYCGSKVTNGDFSWILASITQDESYQG